MMQTAELSLQHQANINTMEMDNQHNEEDHVVNSRRLVRDEPSGARTSKKNIKQMFNHVVNYQLSALRNLENFYESQVAKLEADRRAQLAHANPAQLDKLNL
jgi:hemerythrin